MGELGNHFDILGILGATSGGQFGWVNCGATILWWNIHWAECILNSRFLYYHSSAIRSQGVVKTFGWTLPSLRVCRNIGCTI